jgi:transposase
VSADRGPSYEELAVLVVRQAERIEQLEAEVAELRRQLGQNSQNSSRPPSSDSPFTKPAPRSLRRRSGRKPGGQPGHPGSTLALVDNPNERKRHEPGPCTGCGADLSGAPEVGMERRQVFDLPPIQVRVIEHQLIARSCPCGTTTCGIAPQGVTGPVQYGPRITAIILYLYVGQFLSKKRTAQALAELFATPVSEGTVARIAQRGADALDGFLTEVADRIAEAEVAGFDETGLRVAGTLHWACHDRCVSHGWTKIDRCDQHGGREGHPRDREQTRS